MNPTTIVSLIFLAAILGCSEKAETTTPSPEANLDSALANQNENSAEALDEAAELALQALLSQCGECGSPGVCQNVLTVALLKNQDAVLFLTDSPEPSEDSTKKLKRIEERFNEIGEIAAICEKAMQEQTPP